jgi:hypothetical protein
MPGRKQGGMMLHSWSSVGHPPVGTMGLWWGKSIGFKDIGLIWHLLLPAHALARFLSFYGT